MKICKERCGQCLLNLTVNAIEMEGYIRALKTIINFLESTL